METTFASHGRTAEKPGHSFGEEMSDEESQTRINLAAAYRLAARRRFTDHIYTHFSARVPGPNPEPAFLINPYGMTFDEVTASNLVKVDLEGNVLADKVGLGINLAGYVIHSAIHAARHDAFCVLHTHTAAGIAVSCQPNGLLMLNQHSMRFHNRIAYHDYEGVAFDTSERERLVRDLGNKDVLILRNHGLLVCGPTVEHAARELEFLERACQIQVASGHDTKLPPNWESLALKVADATRKSAPDGTPRHWAAVLRELDRFDPEYRN